MKSYSTALFIPVFLLITIGVAVESLTTKTPKSKIIVSEVPEIVYDCSFFQNHLFHDSLNNHLDEYHAISEKQGITPVENEAAFQKFLESDQLVRVKNSVFFKLDTFYFSYPYLTPDARDFLDTVGARFNKMIDKPPLKGTKLIVTSLTRTTSTVKRLVRVNRNASLRSPHMNGNSFDLSFNHFSHFIIKDPCDLFVLQETISKVLFDLRKEKKCWVTFERRQQCLHVVARKTNLSSKSETLKDFKSLFLRR